MKELTWKEIYSMNEEELKEYTKDHNPPLPIPIIPNYGDGDHELLDEWVHQYILRFPYKNGTLTYKESLQITFHELQNYPFKIVKEILTEEEINLLSGY